MAGTAPEPFSHAAVCTYKKSLFIFGGCSSARRPGDDTPPFLDTLCSVNIEKMRWEVPTATGKAPSPRGGCTSCLTGNWLLIFGGCVDKDSPPTDELWAFDLEASAWSQLGIRGVSPGPLVHGAAASVGNKAYFFGGKNAAEEPTNGLYLLDVVKQLWEPLDDQGGTRPTPRYGHSLLTSGTNLIMYGTPEPGPHACRSGERCLTLSPTSTSVTQVLCLHARILMISHWHSGLPSGMAGRMP